MGDPSDQVDLRKDYTDAQLMALAASMKLKFQPGTRWEYSNTGYHLLGYICTRAGGKFYGDQLRERVFQPLGMGTRIISERDIVPHRASGYEWANGQLKNQEWVSPTMNSTADGSLYLTAHDLALWDLALYEDKALNARIKEAIWSPVKLKDGSTYPYGFGWELGPVNGHRRVAHSGSWQGFRSQISRFIDDKLTVIVLGNSSTAPPEKVASGIAAHYLPALVPQALADTEPDVTARARDMIAHFERGQQPPAMSKRAKGVFTADYMKLIADDMRDFGKLVSLEPIERKAKGEMRVYAYRTQFEKTSVTVKFALNKAGEIEGVDIAPD